MKCQTRFVFGLVLSIAPFCGAADTVAGPTGLRVDNLTTPLGIDDATPHFSWQLADAAKGAQQTAYRVQVASRAELLGEDKADVWDSGKVEGSQCLNVAYRGPGLKPSTRYWWRVTVWNGDKAYTERDISWWETGLLTESGWRGLATRRRRRPRCAEQCRPGLPARMQRLWRRRKVPRSTLIIERR